MAKTNKYGVSVEHSCLTAEALADARKVYPSAIRQIVSGRKVQSMLDAGNTKGAAWVGYESLGQDGVRRTAVRAHVRDLAAESGPDYRAGSLGYSVCVILVPTTEVSA